MSLTTFVKETRIYAERNNTFVFLCTLNKESSWISPFKGEHWQRRGMGTMGYLQQKALVWNQAQASVVRPQCQLKGHMVYQVKPQIVFDTALKCRIDKDSVSRGKH